jgi:hypothetical protein
MEAEAAAMDRQMGNALLELDRPDAALARVEAAAEAREKLQLPAALADDLRFLAEVRADQGERPAACLLGRRASTAYREAEDPGGEIEMRVILARWQALDCDWASAASTLSAALPLVREQGEPAEQVRLLILAADVEHRARNAPRGVKLLDEARQVARRDGNGALLRLVAEARERLSR